MAEASATSGDKLVAQNRKASHDYAILDTVEAGLVLAGTEVKSLRTGKASLQESWATIENGEAWVMQLHIPPYEQGNRWNLDPVRKRKLLLHRSEIEKLRKALEQKGHTLVPLKLYFTKGRAKLLLGVGREARDGSRAPPRGARVRRSLAAGLAAALLAVPRLAEAQPSAADAATRGAATRAAADTTRVPSGMGVPSIPVSRVD